MADPLCKRVTLSGSDQLEVVFTNDCVSGSYDRDLFVDWVTVDGLVFQAEGGAAIIDRGSGDAAFDGLEVIAGQQALTVNGALRFVVGQQAYAACYDGSGNMTWRLKNGTAYEQVWDAENRLVAVKQSGVEVASYTYDGDGTRVKATVEGGTTAYLGSHLEWTGSASTMKVYYYAGGERVAMRVGSSTVYWFLGDHLGSTAMTVASSGIKVAELRYKAWGETRYELGPTPTGYRFTGQRLESSLGLYHMGARWYDPRSGAGSARTASGKIPRLHKASAGTPMFGQLRLGTAIRPDAERKERAASRETRVPIVPHRLRLCLRPRYRHFWISWCKRFLRSTAA